MGFAHTGVSTLLGVVEGRSCFTLNIYPNTRKHRQTTCIAIDVKGVARTCRQLNGEPHTGFSYVSFHGVLAVALAHLSAICRC